MASTNKTTNYNLSQFIGTDKPAWLSDYNQDMSKIDTGIHNAATTATGADGKADSANTAIGTLTNLTTSVKTDLVSAINEVDTNADTAQETANTAINNALDADREIRKIKQELNWNTFANLTFTGSTNPNSQNVKIAMTESKNQFKVYGQLSYSTNTAGSQIILTSNDTGLRPNEAINITGTTLKRRDVYSGGTRFYEIDPWTYTLNTDGTISVTIPRGNNVEYISVSFIACITILGQFGD